MLHRCGFELRTDAREHCLARTVVIVEHAHLDEFVRKQVDVDLVQYAGGKTVMAHAHDRTQPVRLGAKIAALSVQERAAATAILDEVEYVELSGRADFNDLFVDQLSFPV